LVLVVSADHHDVIFHGTGRGAHDDFMASLNRSRTTHTDDMTQEQHVYRRLAELGIAYERYEHPPVATVEEAAPHWIGIDAMHCKNLFLRNQKGTRHYLVIVVHSKRVDLRAVAGQIGDGKLSFASPERMMTYLGVTPGSVSPFGLMNDPGHQVRVYLDRDLKSAKRVSFHPNINTATLTLAFADFERFLEVCTNPVRYIDVR
jgi:Ala-tRNA(Pro) deacylase